MSETPASGAVLLDFARRPTEARFAELADPLATIDIDLRTSSARELVVLLSSLDTAQRAGMTALGDEERTVLIAPARTGQPHTRRVVAFSHPGGSVTEVAAYGDDVPAPVAPVASTPLPGTRAMPAASPHAAAAEQRVLVTASTDALGLAIATAFIEAGASVVLHGRRPSFDHPTPVGDATVAYVSADLANAEGVDRLAEEAAAALGGPITTLINNLGPWDGTPVSQVSPGAWQEALQSGFTSQLRLTQLLAPGMREQGRGRIINVTTASATKRNHGVYGFVKAALTFLTEALSVELAPEVTVNAVAPGQIEESVPLMNSLNPVAVPAMLSLTPSGRFVTRRELARSIVTLTTDAAFDVMTGATIPLGGGYHLAMDEGA